MEGELDIVPQHLSHGFQKVVEKFFHGVPSCEHPREFNDLSPKGAVFSVKLQRVFTLHGPSLQSGLFEYRRA